MLVIPGLDSEALTAAQERSRKYFSSKLNEYLDLTEIDYSHRVFEISALDALRACLSDTEIETNFDLFTNTLNNFLREDRVKTKFRQAIITAQQAYNHLLETVSRGIPLLEKSKADLEKRVHSIEPEFERMQELKDELRDRTQEIERLESLDETVLSLYQEIEALSSSHA